MGSQYPRALAYSTSSFPVSTNIFKCLPYSQTKASAGDVISVSLPNNTLCDLRTFVMHFKAMTNDVAVPLPTHIESIIDSVYVTVNGVQVTNAYTNYNHLFNMLADYQMEDRRSVRSVLQNGSFLVPAPAQGQPAVGRHQGPGQAGQEFAIQNWLGFVGGQQITTPILDSSILGDIRINFRLAPNAILPTAGSYSIENISFTIKTYSVDDGSLYYSLIQKRLESGGLTVNFIDYYTFQLGSLQNTNFAGRFSLSTQSMNAIYGTLLPYDQTPGYDAAKLTSKYFKMGLTNAGNFGTSVWSVNSLNYPAYGQRTTLAEVWAQTQHAMGEVHNVLGQAHPSLNSVAAFGQEFFVDAVRFNHIGTPEEALWRSGLDSRGTNTMISWNFQTKGVEETSPLVIVETLRTLVIGVGRQIQVIA